ncbi:MAG: hypothetical protein QF535_07550, partial [Anaerolineales bacterium]|nr:hypothetical protein [Anaerolineales bacterium]
MPNRKAAAGLVLGVVLIIVLIPTMIGLLGLGKLASGLFGGTEDIIPTEGKELIALGNEGDIRLIGYGPDASVKVQLQGEVGATFPNLGSDAWYGLAAGDLDGDGYDEVIGLSDSSDIIIIPIDEIAPLMTDTDEASLNVKTVSDLENWDWDVLHFDSGMNYEKNALAAGDFDNDEKDEILVVGENKLVIYDYTGSSYVKTVIDEYDEYCTSEFCSDNANNNIGFSHSVSFGGGVDSVAVGNADYDDNTEIVVAYRTASDYEESRRSLAIFEIWKDDNGNYRTMYDENDELLANFAELYPSATMCDYNEDGKDEILFLTSDVYGVWGYDMDWKGYVDGCEYDYDDSPALASTQPGAIYETQIDEDLWYRDKSNNDILLLQDMVVNLANPSCSDYANPWFGTYNSEDTVPGRGEGLSPTVRKYVVSSTYGEIVSQGSVELPQPIIDIDYTSSSECDQIDFDYDWNLIRFGSRGIAFNVLVAYTDFTNWLAGNYECALNWPVKWVDIACDDFTGNGKMDLVLVEEPGT